MTSSSASYRLSASAARLAQESGFDFVDLKHCHGYLGHELLGAYHRPGPYGGSFENRTRFLRGLVEAVRSSAPALEIGVRLSAYDSVPVRAGRSNQARCTGQYPRPTSLHLGLWSRRSEPGSL